MWVPLLLALAARAALAACPRLCECKWRSGKESAVCQHAGLDALPRPLDPGTQLLDLTGNRLAALPDDAFTSAGLVNLQRIYLADCGLRALRRHTFRNQTNLVELDLSRNRLEAVPSHALAAAPELRDLRLDGNPIARLRADAFATLAHLVRLDLSACRILEVDTRAFFGLETSLEVLELDGNRLRGLRAPALASLRTLHGLELAGNPWECTCELRPLRDWMLRRNVPATVVPECVLPPRLAGQPWDRLELDEFACPPEVSPAASHASGYEGGEVTLACRVSGVPAPRVRWLRGGRPLANTTGAPTAAGVRSVVLRGEGQLSNLTIHAADVQDAGAYTCAAENRAGRAEASVTLAVERRAWGGGGGPGGRALLAGAAVAALLALASCLVALCAYEARKKRQMDRWNEQMVTQSRREDSYEKIEAEQKELEATRAMCAAVAAAAESRKRGDYRNLPSHDTEDEAEGYNEEMETPTPTAPAGASGAAGPTRELAWRVQPRWPPATSAEPDLHIPRLPDYSLHDTRNDSTPESSMSTSLGASGFNNNQSDDNHLNNNPPTVHKASGAGARVRLYAAPAHTTRHDRLDNDLSGSDSEKNYPDLIEMSALGADSYLRAERERRRREPASAPPPRPPDYAFCTMPRRRIERAPADSRSPLLSDSRGGSDSSTGGSLERRASAERHRRGGRRSSSFLNLAGAGARSHRNPSLPTSPSRDSPPARSAPSATPLLDLAGLRAAAEYSRAADSPYAKEDSAYDFHASQLERFLEEYRSLREQLSKMKETRESLQRARPAGAEQGAEGEAAAALDRFPKSILKGRPSVAVTAASSALADAESPLALRSPDYPRAEWMAGALYRA